MTKLVLRNLQTLFPFMHDFRFSFQFFRNQLFDKVHDADFEALAFFSPPPDLCFLDIGSNRGEAIHSMLMRMNSNNPIIGFEPNPLVFEKLHKKFNRHAHITLHNLGLGDKKDKFTLYIPYYRKWMFDGLASFERENAAHWLETRMWNYNKNLMSLRKVECRVDCLDDFKYAPFFIKMDVQGFELNVLKGAQKTLKDWQPILLIESITPEIIEFLHTFGYECYRFDHGKFSKGIGALNTFAMTADKIRDVPMQ